MENTPRIPQGYHSVTPYLIAKDAARAIEFYKAALGAEEKFRIVNGGVVGHAELLIGNSMVMIADEFPDMGVRGPRSLGGTPVSFMIYVADADAATERAAAAGMKVTRPIRDQFYGDRSATLEDPFGHAWTLATRVEDVSPEEMQKRATKLFG